jgi:hypothetical protein
MEENKINLTKEEIKKIKSQDMKERALIFFTMTLALLPIRYLFYTYVSKHWLGSFGLMTGVAILLIILTNKNKLGKFGKIWQRQIKKIARGKIGIFLFIQASFMIAFYAGYLYFIDLGNNEFKIQKEQVQNSFNQANIKITNMGSKDFVTAMYFFKVAFHQLMTDPQARQSFIHYYSDPRNIYHDLGLSTSMANDISKGNLESFSVIFMVEQVEQLGLLIYFRFFYKNKETQR